MTDKKRIVYTYGTIEAWEEFDATVQEIIKKETGKDHWIATRSIPPISYPPPLSADSIEKIKNVNDEIRVNEIDEDEH
ncbi:hypothetical protein N7465_011932 [Penicillium sp. CMV-2018d]|nr:hypothetical protein N7465_011932 [Penicillium sp. CMV-2018d]